MDLCPSDCANREKIPFLSTNTQLHVREIVYEDSKLYIEDYIESAADAEELIVLRQVFFAENPTVVQSEVPLVYRNLKTSKAVTTEEMKATSVLCPIKAKRQVIFDRNRLTFEVYAAFLAAIGLQDFTNRKLNILVCGTGAGVFTMFLKAQMGKWIETLASVDNNEHFVQLGKQYFGFHEDAELKSVIADAYHFVKESKSETYDLVFMDVCYEQKDEEGISPPRHFLAPDFIGQLHRIMKKESVCAINTMIKSEEKKKELLN